MAIAARVKGIGWEYAHVAIDDHSRAAYVEVLPDQTGATTAAFLKRTIAWFAQRGVRITQSSPTTAVTIAAGAFRLWPRDGPCG